MRFGYMVATALLALAPATALAQPAPADAQLRAIYEAEWAWRQKEFAQIADGLRSKSDDHFPAVTPADWARRRTYWKTVLDRARIPAARLSPEEQLNTAVLKESLRAKVANIDFCTYEAPLNSDSYFWGGVKPYSPLETADDYRRYIGRLKD
jgi:uncharacterized protein (DUF885 family)